MNQATVRALIGFAFILLMVGAMIPAPMARLAAMSLSAALSLVPIRWGTKAWRIVGILLLVLSLGLALDAYPEAVQEMARYTEHARAH